MSPNTTPIGAILKVNGHLLQAFLFGAAAWLIWPTNPKWWGFGLLSMFLGVAALASVIAALRAMTKLYIRERELARFAAIARVPAPSELADDGALKDAGMFHD
ncbi:MAG: hypothetical protein R3D56_11655 [Paracoccaceae bacterium]